MNLVYADAGLGTSLGHHANTARALRAALAAQDVPVRVCASQHVDQALRDELNAQPVFRVPCYLTPRTSDELEQAAALTAEDLASQCPDGTRLYWNTAQAVQVLGVLLYLQSQPRSQAVVELGVGPHPDQEADSHRYSYVGRDIRVAKTSVHHRLAFCAFDERSPREFTTLLGFPVQAIPMPRDAVPRTTRTDGPLTVAFLGHQRHDKGYHLVPEIVRRLLATSPRPLHFLIHDGNAASSHLPAVQEEVRALARQHPTVVRVEERLADAVLWQELLDQADLIVCPYCPRTFRNRYSAVAYEAVANGIPLVLPDFTSPTTTIRRWIRPATFPSWDAASVAEATLRLIEHWSAHQRDSQEGIEAWARSQGAHYTAKAILERFV